MIGTLVRLGVTKGLEALGVEKDTAVMCGWIAGGTTTILTLDAASLAVDGSVLLADGMTSAGLDVVTSHSHWHAEITSWRS